MRFIIFFFLGLLCVGLQVAGAQGHLDELLDKDVPEIITAIERFDDGIRGPFYQEFSRKIRDDPRDWEAELALALDPNAEMGHRMVQVALSIIDVRQSSGDRRVNDRLTQLTEGWALRLEKGGDDDPHLQDSELPDFWSSITQILRFRSDSALESILEYANSEIERRNSFFTKFTFFRMAEALSAYGEASHLDLARSLRPRVEKFGDPALIEQWAQAVAQIEKRTRKVSARTSGRTPLIGGESATKKDAADGKTISGDLNKYSILVLFLLLGGVGFFLFKPRK